MDTSLEELRAQRAKIQEHLNWLDAQIRFCQTGERGEGDEQEKRAADEVLLGSSPRPTAQSISDPDLKSTAPDAFVSFENNLVLPSPSLQSPLSSNLQGELVKMRWGCSIFFILAALLFLFLLFGLPYLR